MSNVPFQCANLDRLIGHRQGLKILDEKEFVDIVEEIRGAIETLRDEAEGGGRTYAERSTVIQLSDAVEYIINGFKEVRKAVVPAKHSDNQEVKSFAIALCGLISRIDVDADDMKTTLRHLENEVRI